MGKKIELKTSENSDNRIKTEKELKEILKKYQNILNKPIYDYLSALIALDITVLKKYISDETRLALSELEIYKEVAKYNIYKRTINLLTKEEKNLNSKIIVNDKNEMLTIYANDYNIKLFEYNHVDNIFGKLCEDYKSRNIGTISIFNTLSRMDLTEEDIVLIKEKLERVKEIINPYGPYHNRHNNGRFVYEWEVKHKQEILRYKSFLENIKENYTVNEKNYSSEVNLINNIHNILSEEFGLLDDSYDLKKVELEIDNYQKPYVKNVDKLVLNKTLTKKMPNLIINDNIKYI